MGYASYSLDDGREAGYAVKDTCNQDGCDEKIDRGLACLCGETPGGDEHGCGGYFCSAHLLIGYFDDDDDGEYHSAPCYLCPRCFERWQGDITPDAASGTAPQA